jgi:molybdopterin biosynthesis enzyme
MSGDMISASHSGHCVSIEAGEAPAIDSGDLTPELRDALEVVEQTIEDLNAALRQAVQAGATIELRRRTRIHSGDGCWADQMAPLILPKSTH